MKITLEIPAERLANLFTTFIESGDPVSTASRGGWCSGVFYKTKRHNPPRGKDGDPWYADPIHYRDGEAFTPLEVREYHEETNTETKHYLNAAKVAKGLAVMAEKYGHLFQQIIADNIDAPCADIFLQCCLFGEEKYA